MPSVLTSLCSCFLICKLGIVMLALWYHKNWIESSKNCPNTVPDSYYVFSKGETLIVTNSFKFVPSFLQFVWHLACAYESGICRVIMQQYIMSSPDPRNHIVKEGKMKKITSIYSSQKCFENESVCIQFSCEASWIERCSLHLQQLLIYFSILGLR